MAMTLPTLLASWADSAARQPNPPPKIVPIPRFRHLLSVPPEITSKISNRLIYSYIILINHSSFTGYETKKPNTSGSCSRWTHHYTDHPMELAVVVANHLCADISINLWGPVAEPNNSK